MSEVAAWRRARERALALVFEADLRGQTVAEVLARYPAPPEQFALQLANGAEHCRRRADALLADHAHNWRVDRMPAVDRSILRIGIYELLDRPDTSAAVIINEAVELAKRYSSDEAPSFINGVLAAVASELEDAREAGGEATIRS
ncbi:MAG TPA: transcription antitermination factor NusB [Acidimicrobiales bacterium]